MKNILNINQIKTAVTDLGMKYGAERVFLFGSYARGSADENSDVDLRIDRGQIKGWALGGLLLDLEASLNKKIDLLTTGSLDKSFLDTIKEEEVLLYDRNAR